MSPRRRATGVVALALALVALAGCSGPPEACAAVGWINTVQVELSGDASRVDAMVLCDASGCPDGQLPTAAPGESGAVPGVIGGTRLGESTWTVSTLSTDTPGQVTLVALDAAGARLVEETVDATWERTGGTEDCGGPHTATVELTVP